MATTPAVRGVGAVASSSTTDIVPAFGTGLSQPLVDDITLIVVETNAADAGVAAPSGWEHVTGSPLVANGATNPTALSVLWRRFVNGDTAPTITKGSRDHLIGRCIHFSGCRKTGSPFNVIQTSTETGDTDGTPQATGVTTTRNNCLCVIAVSNGRDATVTTNFSGYTSTGVTWTERIDNGNAAGDGGQIGCATGGLTTAGATGAVDYSSAGTGSHAMIVLALDPDYRQGSATVSGTSSISGVGYVQKRGAGEVSGSGSLSGVGYRQSSGGANVAASGVVASIGYRESNGAADVVGVSAIAGVGYVQMRGAGEVSGSSSIDAIGFRECRGYGEVSGTGAISGAGYHRPYGYSELSADSDIAVVGYRESKGSFAIQGDANISGNGYTLFQGSAELLGIALIGARTYAPIPPKFVVTSSRESSVGSQRGALVVVSPNRDRSV